MKRDLTIETGTFSVILLIVMVITGVIEGMGIAYIITIVGFVISLTLKTGFEILEIQNRVLIDQNKFLIKEAKKQS